MFTPLSLFTLRPEGREEGSLEGSPEAIRGGHAAPFPLNLFLSLLLISAHSVSLRLASFLCLSTVQPPSPPTFKRCSPRVLSLTLLRRASSINPLPAAPTQNNRGGGYPRSSNPFLTPISLSPLTPIESYL